MTLKFYDRFLKLAEKSITFSFLSVIYITTFITFSVNKYKKMAAAKVNIQNIYTSEQCVNIEFIL